MYLFLQQLSADCGQERTLKDLENICVLSDMRARVCVCARAVVSLLFPFCFCFAFVSLAWIRPSIQTATKKSLTFHFEIQFCISLKNLYHHLAKERLFI
jgi:hypothetical protein